MNKAIFLDRDGTLIEDKHYLNDVNNVVFLPDVLKSLKALHKEGFLLIIVTNQSGVARGLVSIENIEAIHNKIAETCLKAGCPIAAFYYSPHGPDSNHPSRKPNPGMLLQAARDLKIDLQSSWMVGDKIIDLEAGLNAGCKSILLSSQSVNVSQYGTQAFQCPTFIEASKLCLKMP